MSCNVIVLFALGVLALRGEGAVGAGAESRTTRGERTGVEIGLQ
jgi:hypothetical protein